MVLVVTLLRMIIVCISMDKSCRLAKEEGSSSFPSGAAGSCATQLVRAAMFCPSVHRQDRRCAEFLKRFLKIMESGLEPMREKSGPSGNRTHAGLPNPCHTPCVTGVRRPPGPGSRPNPCHKGCVTGVRPVPGGFDPRFGHYCPAWVRVRIRAFLESVLKIAGTTIR